MKKDIHTSFISIVLICLALFFAGCASTGNSPSPASDTALLAVKPVVKTGVAMVLNKNPDYAGAVLALSASADLALDGVPLTIESIAVFMDAFSAKWNIDKETRVLLGSLIQDVTEIYAAKHGQDAGSVVFDPVKDPTARAYLRAFADALRDAVALHKALSGS